MKRVFLPLLLLILLCSASASPICPLQASDRASIRSDQVKLIADNWLGSENSQNYSYSYDNVFYYDPEVAIGLTSFNVAPSSVLGFEVLIKNNTQAGVGFLISFNSNGNWKQMRMNFLSTDRKDLEIGSLVAPTPIQQQSFQLSYTFQKNWFDINYLKVKVFLHSILLEANQDNSIKVQLDQSEVKQTGIVLSYSSANSTTLIRTMVVDVVIFDVSNPSFKFAEGVITQRNLKVTLGFKIAAQEINEMRTFIVGITSFEVSSNSPISLYSSMLSNFYLAIGPTMVDCEVNSLTVSYLVLSVFEGCGNCGEYILNHNGTCVKQCPGGYHAKNGSCEEICCPEGQVYNIEKAICQTKPFCPVGFIFSEKYNKCHTPCNLNEIYNGETCACVAGFNRIDGKCAQCPTDSIFNEEYKKCHAPCKLNEIFNGEICACVMGFYMIDGKCGQCPAGLTYDILTHSCRKACGENEMFWNGECTCRTGYYFINGKCDTCGINEMWWSNKCVCRTGYQVINGRCDRCPPGFKYLPDSQSCMSPCGANQIWHEDSCICLPGYFWIDGTCGICPAQQVYEPSLQGCRPICRYGETWSNLQKKCICAFGYYLINGACGQCHSSMIYDELLGACKPRCHYNEIWYRNEECVCLPGFHRISGTCGKCPPDRYFDEEHGKCRYKCLKNEVLVNERCVCSPGFLIINRNCGKCPPDSIYDSNVLVCRPSCPQNEFFTGLRCVCRPGLIRNDAGICLPPVVAPTCKENEQYDEEMKMCVCVAGYNLVKGICTKIPECKEKQYWNGVACICESGYIWNQQTCKCEKDVPPIPECGRNSFFNGIKCVCIEKFFEIYPGTCGICPPYMTWNGRKCTFSPDCWEGYVWSSEAECCITIAASKCPPHSYWNGVQCHCSTGYNKVNEVCIKCTEGYRFDGKDCVFSGLASDCQGDNQYLVNGTCVCRENYYNFQGSCLKCPETTRWNGQFCEGMNDGCNSIPFSQVVNGECICQDGYSIFEGICRRTEFNSSFSSGGSP